MEKFFMLGEELGDECLTTRGKQGMDGFRIAIDIFFTKYVRF